MSNSRVKSDAEYSMIRSNKENHNSDPNPFKPSGHSNDYFDAITRRHKEEQQFANPFDANHSMMPTTNQMAQVNHVPSNHMPQSNNYLNELPMENVTNIKQSIASNQSTGSVTDSLTTPFETVSFDPNTNNFDANLNPNYNHNTNPNINVHGYNNQAYNNTMYNTKPQTQVYNNTAQNNQMNPLDISGHNNLQNRRPTVNQQPMQQEMSNMIPQRRQVEASYNNFEPSANQQMDVGNPYVIPALPGTNDQVTITQQADTINELINGINRGSIGPELSYEGPSTVGHMNNTNPYVNNSGVDDIAIMDDIDKELEAMLHETDMDIDKDNGDFTSENENLIEKIKRAENHQGSPTSNPKQVPVPVDEDIYEEQLRLKENARKMQEMQEQQRLKENARKMQEMQEQQRLNEETQKMQQRLDEMTQPNNESLNNFNTPTHPNEAKKQPDNALDQMINELDNDGPPNKTSKKSGMSKSLSDTLTLALDKNEVMQISKEKMLAEDLEDGDINKNKSKIDILINVVLLVMIVVVLGLVAKMILG